jgi:hypothetical protein
MARRPSDPIRAAVRRSKVERKLGTSTSCTRCGESRIEALVARSRPRLCEECYRERRGVKRKDEHHIAGKANSPVVIEVPANDHRAVLNQAQYEWPPRTLQNPDGSPILAAAAALRGIADILTELVAHFLHTCAAGLELIDRAVIGHFGDLWWQGTSVADWRPA